MAGVGMRQKQYTLDTLDEALMYDGEVGAMPDREQLRDQIEWDIGVYDTLHQLKQMQIREQIALDTRHQQTITKNVSKDKNETAAPQRRASLADYISAAQSGGPIFSDTPSRAAKRLVGNSDNNRKRGSASGLTPPMVGGDDGAVGRRSLFEDLADTAEMSRLRWYVVDPQRWRFQTWSILTELTLFAICIIEPLRVGHIVMHNEPMNMLMVYCDVQLLLDLILHFFVAYDDELRDIQVTSMKHIVARYLQGNFAFDVVVALPWNILVWDKTTHHVRDILRMSKLLGAHRLLSTRSVFSNAPDAMMFNPSLITLWKMLLTILFVWHWVACVYWLVSTHSHESGGPYLNDKDAWSPPATVLATNFTHVRYAYAVTWAIGVTTGGTFPSPSTMLQLLYGNLVAIVGFLLMSLVIGSATTALSDMQAQSSEVSIRLQHIDRYMRYKRLPSSIRRRIVQFYRFQYTSLNRIDENEVLVGLPRALRVQMQLIMHKQIFTQLPLFWLCSEEEILLITQRLRPCVIMPGEMLIKQDRLAVGLFLLMKGAVETLRDGDLVIVLLAVAAFGENALRGTPSNCSIRALRFCETTVLLREDFAVIEQMNPVVRRWLDVYILERDRKLSNPQTRRQSMETKSAAIKSVRCRDGWHTHDSKSLLSRRSGTDTTARRVVVGISKFVYAMRVRQARHQRKTRARTSFAKRAPAKARNPSIFETLRAIRRQRIGSMSGIANLGLPFSTRTTPEMRSSSDNEGESVLSSESTKTSSADTAHGNQPARPTDKAVDAAERGVRFTDSDEAEHFGFLDGVFANNRPNYEARVSFHTSVAVEDNASTSKAQSIAHLSRHSLAEMDSIHKTHTPPSSSDNSHDLFNVKDVVSAKLTNTLLSPKPTTPTTPTVPTVPTVPTNLTLRSKKGQLSTLSLPQCGRDALDCNKKVPSPPPPGGVQNNLKSHTRDSDASDMRSLLGANLKSGHNRRSSTFAAVNFTGFEGAFGAREDDEQATWREQHAIYANFQRQFHKDTSEKTPTCLQA